MMIRRKRAFVLAELLTAVFITLLMMIIAIELFMSISKNSQILMAYLNCYLKGREVVDIVSRDCRMASRVMDGYAGYMTTDDCLVLKVPSVDESGDIIDVNAEFDYVIYRLNGADLWKTVIPAAASARDPYDGVFKKDIESFYVSSAGAGLSDITHKSSVTYLTLWMAISKDILGK